MLKSTRYKSNSPFVYAERLRKKMAAMDSGKLWAEVWGVMITFSMDQSGLSWGKGSTSKTSKIAPAISPD